MDIHIEIKQKGNTNSCLLLSTRYVKSKEKTKKIPTSDNGHKYDTKQ